jgi:cob(I)alamin adenosyltransferase
MVQLTRIYTRGGDTGKTSLGDGSRVSKNSLRMEAIGTIDEVNAFLGISRLYVNSETNDVLGKIQNDLFDVGADLCYPEDSSTGKTLRLESPRTLWMESEIDNLNTSLSPLNSFVLPGGSDASSFLHAARTITRRAERVLVALGETEKVNPEVIKYINRLSDYLFVLGRFLNNKGEKDVLWVPGGNK